MDLATLLYILAFFGSPSLGYLIVRFAFPDIRIYPWNIKLSVATFFGFSVFLVALIFSFLYALEGFILGLTFGPFMILVLLDITLRVRGGGKVAIPKLRIKLSARPKVERKKVERKVVEKEEKKKVEKVEKVEKIRVEAKKPKEERKEVKAEKRELTPYERHRLRKLGLQALPEEKKVIDVKKLVEEPLPEELDLSVFEEEPTELELEKTLEEEELPLELEEELDLRQLEEVAGISEVEELPKRKVCPRCGSSKGTIIYCPHCGKAMCSDCVPVAGREGGFAIFKCPYCGKEIYVKI